MHFCCLDRGLSLFIYFLLKFVWCHTSLNFFVRSLSIFTIFTIFTSISTGGLRGWEDDIGGRVSRSLGHTGRIFKNKIEFQNYKYQVNQFILQIVLADSPTFANFHENILSFQVISSKHLNIWSFDHEDMFPFEYMILKHFYTGKRGVGQLLTNCWGGRTRGGGG